MYDSKKIIESLDDIYEKLEEIDNNLAPIKKKNTFTKGLTSIMDTNADHINSIFEAVLRLNYIGLKEKLDAICKTKEKDIEKLYREINIAVNNYFNNLPNSVSKEVVKSKLKVLLKSEVGDLNIGDYLSVFGSLSSIVLAFIAVVASIIKTDDKGIYGVLVKILELILVFMGAGYAIYIIYNIVKTKEYKRKKMILSLCLDIVDSI